MALDPVTGAIIGQTIAGGIGGLLGRKRQKPPDYTYLLPMIKQSGVRQREIIGGVRPQTTAVGNQFRQDAGANSQNLIDTISGMGRNYVNDMSDTSGQLTEASAQAGKRRIMEARPELEQNARESLAASGINRGGALLTANEKIRQNLGSQIGELNSNLELSNISAKRDALRDAFTSNRGAVEQATGLNSDMLTRLFESGRDDLINEAAQLLAEEKDRTNQIIGVNMGQTNANFAADTAAAKQKQDLINVLLSGLGKAAGSYLTREE